jgi:aryl-alcohol dehydrogenase-like predicted oxidoreductase
MNRRAFSAVIAGVAAGLGGAGAIRLWQSGGPVARGPLPPSDLPARRLGRTGVDLPILGLGGHHLGLAGSERNARRLVETALEEGIRFFDTAESYQAGNSERWLGAAIREVRSEVFLMSKTHEPRERSAKSAREHLDGSLERLGTDYLDLWQLHSIKSPEDVDLAFRPGGAMEYIFEAKREGRVRWIGVTGHMNAASHERAIHYWDEGWKFDTLQFPINPIDYHQESFQRVILDAARERDIAVIAMKTSADGALVRDGVCTHEECLRYVWSLPVSLAVVGMERQDLVRRNASVARARMFMDPPEREAFRERVRPQADPGLERYKRSAAG